MSFPCKRKKKEEFFLDEQDHVRYGIDHLAEDVDKHGDSQQRQEDEK
jgi:hypothetical protein